MKKLVKKLRFKSNKLLGGSLTAMIALFAIASSAFASGNPDLDAVTTTLTDGAGDMKTNFITMIGVVIGIIVVVFGIGWLITLFKRNMNKA